MTNEALYTGACLHRSKICRAGMIYAPLRKKLSDVLQCKQYLCCMQGVGMSKLRCSGGGRMFSTLLAFDLDLTEKFQHNGRRCLTEHQVWAKGMVQNEIGWWRRMSFEGVLTWPASRNEEENA